MGTIDTIEILKKFVLDMGGTVIACSDTVVGFRDTNKTFLKLSVKGDAVILHQVSGPERGKKAEVASLSGLLSAMTNLT